MSFYNEETGEEYENEDDYLRSLKKEDSYYFVYEYEYVADRFGEGDDDVTLEVATLNVTVSWDDALSPGYTVSYSVDAPTALPNPWTGDTDEIFDQFSVDIDEDMSLQGVDMAACKY